MQHIFSLSRHFFVLTALLFLLSVAISHAANPVVVIDAGHGGKSPGAVYKGVMEKNINLSVALLVGNNLKNLIPKADIIFTRSDDRDLTLNQRTDIANKAEADIFISIHCNANPSPSASGGETYVMGVDKSGANLEVAMRENSVITLEDDFSTAYGGYDPKSAESFIVFSLMQYAHQDKSLKLATEIQKQYAQATALKSRGVKQAGFLVLWRTAMPSVLSEIGFLSNDNDRIYLKSTTGQQNIANAIATAAKQFLQNNTQQQNNNQTTNTTTNNNNQTKPTTTKLNQTSYTNINNNKTDNPQITYRVQITTAKKPIKINSDNFGPWVTVIKEHKVGNLYKYSVGVSYSYKEALNLQRKLENKYRGCFVTAYDADNQISLEKAKQILEK